MGDSSLLEKVDARFLVDLLPSKLGAVNKGVRDHLNGLLLRYSYDLDGVVLAYRNERVLTRQGQIHPYFPLVRVEVTADVVVFRPQPGKRLVGMVNKIGADYIGLLVLGFINAAIGADQIRAEFRCHLGEGAWVNIKDPQHRLTVGTQVHFHLHQVQREGEFVSLLGSLLRPNTGAEGHVKAPKQKKGKKRLAAESVEQAGNDKKKAKTMQQQQQQQRRRAAAQQQQHNAEQQQQQQQFEQANGTGDNKKKKTKKEEEARPKEVQGQPAGKPASGPAAAAPAGPSRQQLLATNPGSAVQPKPQKKRKKDRVSAALPNGAKAPPAEGAPAAAPTFAAEPVAVAAAPADGQGSSKPKKKRKADQAAMGTPGTATVAAGAEPMPGGTSAGPRKKKKKVVA